MKWKRCGLAEAVRFYNEVRPHMGLEKDKRLRTPLIAYYEKLRPEQRKGIAYEKEYAYARKAKEQAWRDLRLELEKEGYSLVNKRRRNSARN
jgi:hypothetical protein